MAEDAKTPEPLKPPVPVCPYCGEDPCIPEMIGVTYGILVGKIFCCPNRKCRKVFNVELIGEDRRIQTPRS